MVHVHFNERPKRAPNRLAAVPSAVRTAVPLAEIGGRCACGGHCPRCAPPAANAARGGNGSPTPSATPAAAPGQFIPPPPVAPATGACNVGKPALSTYEGKTSHLCVPHYEFHFTDATQPCLSCPNSASNACPKLGDRTFTPLGTGPVQFSWQARMHALAISLAGKAPKEETHVIQKIERTMTFTTGGAGYQSCPSPYWEAFTLDGNGNTELDYWQGDLPNGSAGSWSIRGSCYLTNRLPGGMVVGSVACAGNLPSSTSPPKGLGREIGVRSFGASFDFTGPAQRHG